MYTVLHNYYRIVTLMKAKGFGDYGTPCNIVILLVTLSLLRDLLLAIDF